MAIALMIYLAIGVLLTWGFRTDGDMHVFETNPIFAVVILFLWPAVLYAVWPSLDGRNATWRGKKIWKQK